MGVDGGGACKAGAGAGTAADGFVILPGGVAEQKIVHRGLGGGAGAERAQQGGGDGLADLGIAGDDRRAGWWGQKTAFGDDDGERLQAAFVERDVGADQATEAVQDGGGGDGAWCVEIVVLRGTGAGEVDGGGFSIAIDGDFDFEARAVIHLIIESAICEFADDGANGGLRVGFDMAHIGFGDIPAIARDDGGQRRDAGFVGGDLRLHVGDVLVRVAGGIFRANEDVPEILFLKFALRKQEEIVDDDAFVFQGF
jgi:hypothetical protein